MTVTAVRTDDARVICSVKVTGPERGDRIKNAASEPALDDAGELISSPGNQAEVRAEDSVLARLLAETAAGGDHECQPEPGSACCLACSGRMRYPVRDERSPKA